MLDGWALWLLVAGLAVGAAGMAMITLRLPREDDDLGAEERRTEADWIATTIERHGGVAPASLVEEVLELHGSYLASARPPAPVGATAPPVPPPWTGEPHVPGMPVPTAPGASVPPGAPGPTWSPGGAPPMSPPPGYMPSAGPPPGPPAGTPPAGPPPGPPAGPPTQPGS